MEVMNFFNAVALTVNRVLYNERYFTHHISEFLGSILGAKIGGKISIYILFNFEWSQSLECLNLLVICISIEIYEKICTKHFEILCKRSFLVPFLFLLSVGLKSLDSSIKYY